MRILLLFVATFWIAQGAFAEVHIAPKLSYFSPKLEMSVKPLGVSYKPLTTKSVKTDELKILIQTKNALFKNITAMVCSESELQNLLAKRPYQCIGQKKFGSFDFIVKPLNNEIQYLVLKNANILRPKNVIAQILLTNELTEEQRQELKKEFEKLMQSIHYSFITPKFDLTIEGCGEVNAFSTIKSGDITICSEVLFESIMRGKKGVLAGIFTHELGHSLLNLWGLPNYDNEKTADEFAAVVMLMNDERKLVEDFLSFYEENQNTTREVRSIEASKDQHPLSVQRIAAIRTILEDPTPVIKRWNKTLYPHMTEQALQDVIAGKIKVGADSNLASEILAQRKQSLNQTINNQTE